MSNINLEILERYVLNEDKSKALELVTPFTEQFYYIQLMTDLNNTTELNLLKERVDEFYKNYSFNYQNKNTIKIKYLLSSLNEKISENERKEIMNELNDLYLKIKFTHLRPKKVQMTENVRTEENKDLKSCIGKEEEMVLSNDYLINEYYKSPTRQNLNKIKNSSIPFLDLNRIKSPSVLKDLFQINVDWFRSSQIIDIMKSLTISDPLMITRYALKIAESLNLDQLDELMKNDFFLNLENLFKYYFSVKFNQLNKKTQIEERNQQIKILEFFENKPIKYKQASAIHRKRLLQLNYELKMIDEKEFIKYLENSHRLDLHLYKNDYQRRMKNYILINKCNDLNTFNDIQSELIIKYLDEIFTDSDGYKKYLNYFDENKLQNLYYANKMMQGKKNSNINNIFNDSQLKEMNERKMLLLDRNQKKFKLNEKVELNLKIKNIKTLKVRVFEVNTENYLNQNKNGDYKDIKVESLIPFEEYSYTYNKTSMIVHREKLDFSSITDKKRGVFIIDLIGGGLNSKAIIYKGNLTLLFDKITGRNCLILDEDNNVCKSNRTGLYIGNKFLKTNPQNGVINIPHDISYNEQDVIVVHDNFANISNLKLQDLDFKLESSIIFNSESFMPGLETKLVLKNTLLCNLKKSDLSLLKNTEIYISTFNMAGVEQKQILKDQKLSNDQDLEINFRTPSKMQTLNIILKSEIKKNGKTEIISSNVDLIFERKKMIQKLDMALKKNQDKEFFLELFGINGEPIINEKTEVTFTYSKNHKTFNFISDSKGRVNLGKLKEINELRIQAQNCYFDFQIKDLNKDSYYPDNFDIIENEIISFPLKTEDSKNVYLIKNDDYRKTNNFTSKVKIQNNILTIDNLQSGRYLLFLNDKNLQIVVHRGSKKNLNGVNIINDDYIFGLENKRNALVGEVSEDENNFILNLEGDLEDTRIHLLSSNYKENFFKGNLSQCPPDSNMKYLKKTKNNSYFSEAKLSDELIYVYNRKTKNTYLGNTLDKPGMLLKRNKVVETKENKEILQQGTGYVQNRNNLNHYRTQCGGALYNDCKVINQIEIVYLREFFKNPGQILPNLKPENNKLFIKKSDFENQSFVYAIVNTKDTSIIVEINTKDIEVEKIDLRLEESRKKGFVYRYDRSMNYFQPQDNSKIEIPHVDKQEYCFIEDVKSLFEAIMVVSNSSTTLEIWKFLSNWNDLNAQDKLKKYDRYCSHEINLFLKLKDRTFFDEVVKPFIENKKEKTLVDFYLLENAESLKTFSCLSNLNSLSPLECILLIDGLKEKHRNISHSLLKNLEMKSKLIHRNQEDFKKKFDSLLSSQKQEEILKVDENIAQCSNYAPPPSNAFSNSNATFGQSITRNNAPMSRNMQVEKNVQYEQPVKIMNRDIEMKKKMNRKKICKKICLDTMNYQDKAYIVPQEIFTPLQGTVEYNEKKFYHSYSNNINNVEKFWFDLGSYILKNNSLTNFFSENFIHSCDDPTEALAVLAFIDLKFVKIPLETTLINNNLRLKPKTNLIVLTKEIIQNEGKQGDTQLMLGQRFFDPNNKFKLNEKENVNYEKPVKEFIKGVIYESNIVVTNSTGTPLTFELISEIPEGSIAFYSLDTMNVQSVVLQPLNSKSFTFHFYFPESGSFSVYPATVVKGDQLLGTAQIEETIEVKDNRNIRDMDTISDILSTGNISKILKFMESKNILNPQLFNFNDIYWLLKSKSFYDLLIPLLRKKGIFDFTVWSYSILHNDLNTFKEFLNTTIIKSTFSSIKYLHNNVVNIDDFEIKEYYPLVNPRVHSLNQNNNILNISFKKTYTKLLEYLFQKGKLVTVDKLTLINYLICQDRMEESLKLHLTITESEIQSLECRIQYDYLTAYLDFINGYPNFNKAKSICQEYLSFPVLTWRNLFVEIANQW